MERTTKWFKNSTKGLRAIRLEYKLSLQDISELTKIEKCTLSDIERGIHTPRRQTKKALERLFGRINWWRFDRIIKSETLLDFAIRLRKEQTWDEDIERIFFEKFNVDYWANKDEEDEIRRKIVYWMYKADEEIAKENGTKINQLLPPTQQERLPYSWEKYYYSPYSSYKIVLGKREYIREPEIVGPKIKTRLMETRSRLLLQRQGKI